MLSLRSRLALYVSAIAAGAVVLTALVSFDLAGRYSERVATGELTRVGRVVANQMGGSIALTELRGARRLFRLSGDLLAVVGPRGELREAGSQFARTINIDPLLSGREVSGEVTTPAGRLVYVGLPVEGNPLAKAIIVARPVGVARAALRPLTTSVLVVGAMAILAALGVAALLARRTIGPIRKIADATSRVAAGDLAHRVEVEGNDELAELAGSFNAMADALAEAQRREREFMASVSHELRTPITAIGGYAEALSDGTVKGTQKRREALAVIRAETARLERLVEDVLDLARLGSKEFRLEPSRADLSDSLHEAAAAHQAQANQAGVTLQVEAPEGLWCQTDPGRVRQVVSNLVENALRATPTGGLVKIAARRDPDITIEISDTGPGIAPEHLPHVFERSYLWKASRGERAVGTGLGLAIVRELVQALGGRVSAESRPTTGSIFTIHLPG